MNKKQFKETKELTEFQKQCLTNPFNGGEKFAKLWRKAKDLNEFLFLCRTDEELKTTQGVAELFKNDWRFLRSQLGDKCRKTMSDVGGLKIGNNNFEIIIPNGMGDGETRYAVFEPEEKVNTAAFNYWTLIKGKNIKIYSYDCGYDVLETISGEFSVYYKDGIIIIKKEK